MMMAGTAARYEPERLTEVIVEKVAELEGVDPLDLHPPLYDAVDTDDLESLVTDEITGECHEGIQVEFQYYGYDIVVDGEGEIAVLST